jgi:hypothetical protein
MTRLLPPLFFLVVELNRTHETRIEKTREPAKDRKRSKMSTHGRWERRKETISRFLTIVDFWLLVFFLFHKEFWYQSKKSAIRNLVETGCRLRFAMTSWEQTQHIRSLSQWPILNMVHICVLKWKSRTEVGGWMYCSRHSWSYLINYSVEMRHWKMGEILGNAVRIHSVHSKL